MSSRVQCFAIGAIIVAALMVLIETLYFASLRLGYSHISSTISELGETGGPHAKLVSFGFFLPVGLLVLLALFVVWRESPDRYVRFALVALSALGAGYVAAAFFPCDPGPLFGTWRTQIHDVVGFIDYAGTGIGYLLVSRHFAGRDATFQAVAFLVAGLLVLMCVALLSVEAAFPVRGAIQRVAEVIQFSGVISVCYLLTRTMSPNESHAADPRKNPDSMLDAPGAVG